MAADLQNHPAFFKYLHELIGRQQAVFGVLPAQQGLGPGDVFVATVDLGLEVQVKFVAGQGQAQVIFQAQTLADGLLHGHMEKL